MAWRSLWKIPGYRLKKLKYVYGGPKIRCLLSKKKEEKEVFVGLKIIVMHW